MPGGLSPAAQNKLTLSKSAVAREADKRPGPITLPAVPVGCGWPHPLAPENPASSGFPPDSRPASFLFMDETRLDKWLWSVRVFKTRAEATAACRAGKVMIGELEAKPGRSVHAGERVQAKVGIVHRTLVVLDVPRSRVGAKQLPRFMTDLTPAAEYEKERLAKLPPLFPRPKGSGRPTKKERRQLEEFF